MIKIGLIDYASGNKIIDIRDKNKVIKAKYAIGADAILKSTLMSEHYIEISFELNQNVSFLRSDYIEWEGDKYTLRLDYQPEQINKCRYKYTLKFEAIEMFFQDIQYYYLNQDLKESEWRLIGNPDYFIKIAVDNINRYFGVSDFKAGTIEPAETKDITFDTNSNTFDALNTIAGEYGAEWYMTGKTINLLYKVSFGSEVDFESEVSVLSMKRNEGESGACYTRILALGSSRNIPNNYRTTSSNENVDAIYQKRLRIPVAKGSAIDAYPDMKPEEVVEGTVIFDDIYPKQVGTIEAIGTIQYTDTDEETGVKTKWNAYKIKDSGINFKEEYVLPGEELRLIFESGDLNGRDFALIFHDKDFSKNDNSQYFEIVRTDDYGKSLPSDIMKPKVGDKYVLYGFNIALVSDQYVPAAEQELYDTAKAWLKEQLQDMDVYECPTVIKHFQDNAMNLEIGQKVKLIDTDGRSSRIMGFEKKLNNKYDAVYTIGDNSTYSRFSKIEKEIKELQHAGIVYENTSGNSVYVIKQFDTTRPSDFNVYSAVASNDRYLKRNQEDSAKQKITFEQGIEVYQGAISDQFGNLTFTSGQFGSGFRTWYDKQKGQSFAEFDNLMVRREMIINTLSIAEIKSVGGQILLSLANMVCIKVEEQTNDYKCYFDNDKGSIPNLFAMNDQVISRKFNGKSSKYYWKRVTGIGTDFILLSKTDTDGLGVPAAGDEIIQFGNRTDTKRQAAIMISAYGPDAPSIKQYAGINSYNLTGKEVTAITPSGNKFTGTFEVKTGNQAVRIPADRGAWSTGMICNYYDRVSHKGALWLCIVPENQTTITEPSESSTFWQKQVAEGQKGDAGNTGLKGDKGDKGDKGVTGAKGDKGDTGPQGPQGLRGLQGAKGDQGIAGAKGADGKTTYFHIKYAPVQNPTVAQLTEIPSTFIGTYVDTLPDDSTDPQKYTWARFEGLQGKNGEQGIPGKNGADGKTSYLHIKYSNDGGKTFTANNGETSGSWIGQYTDFSLADSNTLSAYTWSKIQGEIGPQGVAGAKGADGKPTYTWIRYADNASGGGISNNPTGKLYIGMAYNKTTATESNTPTDYKWSLIKGDKGDTGVQGAKGADGKTTYTWIKYSENADGTGLYDVPKDSTLYIGIAVNKTTASESINKADYVWSRFKGSDGKDGKDGRNGINGTNGVNGTSSYFHVRYSANANGNPVSTTPNKYIGTCVTQSATAPTGYASYSWYEWKGIQGVNGQQGIPGKDGINGKTSYLHIKYSNDAGKTFTGNSGEDVGDWLGQYVDFTETDSTDIKKYQWNRLKGDAGTLNYIEWKDDWKIGNEVIPGWVNNGTTAENVRAYGINPFGMQSVLWKCIPNTDGNASGGFHSPYKKLDTGYAYRFVVFVYKNKTGGSTYHGCYGVANISNGQLNGNPYFWNTGALPTGVWLLMVGIIHPNSGNSITAQSGISGLYNMEGKKIANGTDFKFMSDGRAVNFRSYLYYANDATVNQYFFNPMVHRLDGTEPSIEEILQVKTTSIVEASFQVLDNKIASKVSQTDFNSLHGRVTSAESKIEQQAGQISSTVSKVEGKNAVYKSFTNASTDKPSVPYSKGDLWITYEGIIKQSKNTRVSGGFIDSDWTDTTKYTDDTAAIQAKQLADEAQSKADAVTKGTRFHAGKFVFNEGSPYSSIVGFDTKIPSNVANMWLLEIGGYAYGIKQPFKVDVVFYPYNGSWINLAYTNSSAVDLSKIRIATKSSCASLELTFKTGIYYLNLEIQVVATRINATRAVADGWTKRTTAFDNSYTAIVEIPRKDTLQDLAAANALDVANAKNRTYYQDTAPTVPSEGHRVGDLWYKLSVTDGCYESYRWNGSIWQQINVYVSKSRIEQTDTRITSVVEKTGINSLGNGESLYSKINQTADKITLEVNKIQIGGRNLLLNSKVAKSGKTYNIGYWTSLRNFVVGEELTVSIRGNIPGSKLFGIWFNSGSYGGYSLQEIKTGLYSCTFKVPAGTSTRIIGIYLIGNQSATDSWSFEWIKVEEGNKATDWSPAPEDLEAEINKAQTTADSKTTLTEVASSLTLTNNKISLASKTIELKGTTIAKAIEAEDLKVGNRSALSALEVLKNGTFYAKGSSGINNSLIIDSSRQSIEITSPYSAEGNSIDSMEKSTVLISSQSGGVRVTNDNYDTSIVSTKGIFSNKAGQTVFAASTGFRGRASIVGIGKGTLEKGSTDFDFVAGVAGWAKNSHSNPAPAFGGWFEKLFASGLYIKTRRISSTTNLTESDVFISCYNTYTIYVYLPSNPIVGQVILIRRINSSPVNIHGNGTIISGGNGSEFTILTFGGSPGDAAHGSIALLIYDGKYWNWSYMTK